MASNIPRLAVTALSERLRVVGFTGVDVWSDWVRNDLDQTSGIAHREALALGKSYVIVWADEQGRAKVSVESARQVATLVDPSTRRIVAAVKRWETTTTTEAVVYEADVITRYRANLGATTAGYRAVSTVANPLGVVPGRCAHQRGPAARRRGVRADRPRAARRRAEQVPLRHARD